MSKRGLPSGVKMRHDSHYVEEFAKIPNRSIGRIIPINQIEPNPDQPRVEIGDLAELTSSIKQKGVLEPLLVKPNGDGTWMIIAGERRWRASNLAGLREVPCIELNIDDKSIAEIALIENLQRKDLNIWEEADGLAYLSKRFNYTHEEIAKKIGKSRTTVTESFAIAGLPDSIREKCRQANINAKSTLLEIARQFDEKAMHDFLDDIRKQGLSRDEIRQTARQDKKFKDKILSENKISSVNKKSKNNYFQYISKEKDFSLEIRFNKTTDYEKQDVLRALKEAFESVRN
ncbi:MAG: ParB/RepB/Spo0J family partition protein [Acidobacteria bacterium]|nr:ParB/RepB/Spo0J family partition protein [Acidobacteriota bacterium]